MSPRFRRLDFAQQRRAELAHGLGPVLRAHAQRPVDGGQEMLREASHAALGQRHEFVRHGARGAGRRRVAHDQVMQHGAERIDVGPGPLAQRGGLGVLLDRRVAGLQDGGEGLRLVADRAARGTEVQQDGVGLVERQQHVVGCDVAVVDLLGMQDAEAVQQRQQPPHDPGLRGRLGHLLARLLQRDALQIGHDHIGRAIGFPEAVDLQERAVVEAGQQARFIDEAAPAEVEGLGQRARTHRHMRAFAALGQLPGHVFLDRHQALQRMVLRQVDDAEAAHAQGAQDLQLAKAGAGGKGVEIVLGRMARYLAAIV